MKNRRDKIRERLRRESIDALMVLVEENRQYLSGFTAGDVGLNESSGALFISPEKKILAVNPLYVTQAEQECPDWEIHLHKQGLAKAMPDILKTLKAKTLAFEDARLTVKDHAAILEALEKEGVAAKLAPCADWVEDQRLKKDEKEVRAMQASLGLAEKAFLDILPRLKPGMTEKQAAWELEKSMRELGADSLAFPVIAAAGENAALPHAEPSDRPIRANEPLLFDWGAKKNGYCSDISRTIILGGKGDEQYAKVFNTVQKAQEAGIAALGPGKSAREVDAVARKVIDKAGFPGKFTHGLGHGLGMAVHEAPRLSPLSEAVLEPGMVVTVEPGIYIPGWGGVRLENMAVITETGAQCLNEMDITPG